MQYKYCDVKKKPEVINDQVLRCWCHEPVVFKGVMGIDLAFNLDGGPWDAFINGSRDDSVLVYNIHLPYVILNSFDKTISLERGDFVCDLVFHRVFSIRFGNFHCQSK